MVQAQGLHLVFSSDLVHPDMVVASDPPDVKPRKVLEDLLAPFGLTAVDGPSGTILVVHGAESRRRGSGAAGAPGGRDPTPPAPEPPAMRERVRVAAPSDEAPAAVRTLGPGDIAPLPTPGGDAARALDWLPGITSADTTARVEVRGGAPGDVLFLLDGLEIDEPYHLQDFSSFSSLLDSGAMSRLDVMTGVFPVRYGSRMSGVVDMSSADVTGPARTLLGVSGLNTTLLSQGGFADGAGWLVSARAWRPDTMVDTISVQGDGLDPSYGDVFGKMQYRLAGGSVLSAQLLASRDDVRYQTDHDDGRVAANDDHRYAWLTWKTPWTSRLYSETIVSSTRATRGRTGGTVDAQGGPIQVDDDRSYGSFGVKQDWLFAAGERAQLKWGFDTRRLEARYAYRSGAEGSPAAAQDVAVQPQGSETGAYVAGQFRILTPLSVEVGVRRDRQSLTGESETSPRVSVACDLGERSILRAGWGLFHQPQGINQLQIEDGVLDFFPAESAEQWEIGFDRRFAAGMTLGVSAYRRETTDVRPYYENLFNPFQLFPEAEPDRVRVAPEASLAQGVEIALGADRGRAIAWRASYVLASTDDRIDGAWVPRSQDQRHAIDFALTWRRGEGWEIGLAGLYHSGWPTTDLTAVQVPGPSGAPVIQPIVGPRNALRYPPYHRLDVGVTRRFHLAGGTLGLHFQVMNVYGRENVCCVSGFEYEPQPDGSVRVDRVEGHWLRQLPILGLTFEF